MADSHSHCLHAGSSDAPVAADLEIALAKAIAQDPETLLCGLPPSAEELKAWGQQGADVAAAEGAALAWQRLLPALQSATGSPLSAMAHTLFQVRHLCPGRGVFYQYCLTSSLRQLASGQMSNAGCQPLEMGLNTG